jgi:hypothetical protein
MLPHKNPANVGGLNKSDDPSGAGNSSKLPVAEN